MVSDFRPTVPAGVNDLFTGGGEMGVLMRSIDWSQTPLGVKEQWPQSLRTSLSICLASRFPILIWWGPDLVMLYNDAYRPILGTTKHPESMGQRGIELLLSIIKAAREDELEAPVQTQLEPPSPARIILPTSLIVRASCGADFSVPVTSE